MNLQNQILILSEEEVIEAVESFYQSIHRGHRLQLVMVVKQGEQFHFHTSQSINDSLKKWAELEPTH